MPSSSSTDRNINEAAGAAKSAYDAAAATANDLAQQAMKAALNAGATMRDVAGRAGDAATDVSDRVYKRGVETSQQVSRQVESQPLSSLLVAASAGFIVGLLMARR